MRCYDYKTSVRGRTSRQTSERTCFWPYLFPSPTVCKGRERGADGPMGISAPGSDYGHQTWHCTSQWALLLCVPWCLQPPSLHPEKSLYQVGSRVLFLPYHLDPRNCLIWQQWHISHLCGQSHCPEVCVCKRTPGQQMVIRDQWLLDMKDLGSNWVGELGWGT